MPVGPGQRRRTRQVVVRWDDNQVLIGSDGPVVVQSMTNTDTAEAIATAIQTRALAKAGSELVRITVNTPAAAAEVPAIREQLDRMGCKVPLVGDFHYNGHKLLHDFPECAEALSKYRINPGNVGSSAKRDDNYRAMVEAACRHGKPVRIGVNWGSLDWSRTWYHDSRQIWCDLLPFYKASRQLQITKSSVGTRTNKDIA